MCLSGNGTALEVTADYFGRKQPVESQGWTHFPGAEHATQPKAEFIWPLGDVITTLIDVGLRIVALREMPAGGHLVLRRRRRCRAALPDSYVLVADKPI